MTHRFFVEARRVHGNEVEFSSEQSHQLRSVLRLRPGDQVQVFDGEVAVDRVVELLDAEHGMVIGEVQQPPEPRTRLVVYPALLQRDKFETVLQKLTEIGAAAIAPVVTARTLVRRGPDAQRMARWKAILREAAEQCGRGVVPTLLPAANLSEAVPSADGLRLFAYEKERNRTVQGVLTDRPDVVSMFVGPEGGFTADEVECARRAGAEVVTLGPRVLRTETASPLLAALVLYELGDLSWPAELRDG